MRILKICGYQSSCGSRGYLGSSFGEGIEGEKIAFAAEVAAQLGN